MSPSNVGYFRRDVPFPEESIFQRDRQRSSPPVASPQMAAFHIALPPIPSNTYIGADRRSGLTELTRYETMRNRPLSPGAGRNVPHEPLPSVSQLFTPAPPLNIPPTFSPRYGISSPTDPRSSHLPFQRQASPNAYAVHAGYSIASSAQSQHARPRRDSVPLNAIITHQQPTHQTRSESLQSPYTSHSEPLRQNLQQPQSTSFAGPSQWYTDQSNSYGAVSRPLSAPEQPSGDASNVGKALLRVIREENIPGEGLCWIYEDGSHCRKVIDGEAVNAQWGVTKAGKPRKRLAIACTTCREKKVKCDPGEPKCMQCDKFGRECRFQTSIRGQQTSPGSPSYGHQARTPSSMSGNTESHFEILQSPYAEVSDSYEPPANKQRSPSPELKSVKKNFDLLTSSRHSRPVRKRRRVDSPDGRDTYPGILNQELVPEDQAVPPPLSLAEQWEDLSISTDPLAFECQNDPYDINPRLVLHYMDMYFMHCKATYCIFPRKPFLRWLQNKKAKSSDELMVLYAMLSIGSIFSSRPERKAEGSLFAKITRYAIEKNHGNYSLQLAQSRMLFALYLFALGDSASAWDNGGSAFRAVAGLKLNLEEGITDVGDNEPSEFGLNRFTLIECRRRTFWSAYLMDASSPLMNFYEASTDDLQRYNGYCTGHPCIFQKEDVFARLPCRNDAYENEEEITTPFFDNGGIDPQLTKMTVQSTLGSMAYLVQISSIWEEVLAKIYRTPYQAPESYGTDYDSFYDIISNRLSAWESSLPPHLQYSSSNLEASVDCGTAGTFVSLHALYHITFMKLNRHVRHGHLSLSSFERNVQEATRHARQLLFIMHTLSQINRSKRIPSSVSSDERHDFVFSTPFAGYATLCAIDILSAGGSLESNDFVDTLRMINSGLPVVEELSQFWASARGQRKAIRRRIEELANCVIDNGGDRNAWKMKQSMEKTLGSDHDLFYTRHDRGVGLLAALGVEVRDEEDEVLFIEVGESSGSRGSEEIQGYI